MKILLPLQLIAAGALLAACGPPELVAVPDNPYSNDDSDVVQTGPLTLVASRSNWYERALSRVSTPVEVMLVNRGKRSVPVTLEQLELVDERGRVYRALPAQTIASRLFGGSPPPPESYLEPEPIQPQSGGPSSGAPGEPMQEPPPEQAPGVQSPPPAKAASPSQTFAPELAPGIILVAGHSGGGGHAGGHTVGGAAGERPAGSTLVGAAASTGAVATTVAVDGLGMAIAATGDGAGAAHPTGVGAAGAGGGASARLTWSASTSTTTTTRATTRGNSSTSDPGRSTRPRCVPPISSRISGWADWSSSSRPGTRGS